MPPNGQKPPANQKAGCPLHREATCHQQPSNLCFHTILHCVPCRGFRSDFSTPERATPLCRRRRPSSTISAKDWRPLHGERVRGRLISESRGHPLSPPEVTIIHHAVAVVSAAPS